MSGAITADPNVPGAPPLQEQKKKPDPAPSPPPVVAAATKGMPPSISGLEDTLTRDRAEAEAVKPSMPVLAKPPRQEANTDPFAAFGQPAMWIATIGSLFTRRPFVNAIQAMGGVLKATSDKDAAAAKQSYDTWKVETENAVKLAQFQEKAYDAALKKLDIDAKTGEAELRTQMLANRDENLEKIRESHGIAGVRQALADRKRQVEAVQKQVSQTGPYLKQHVDIAAMRASDDPIEQMKGVVAQQEMDLQRLQGSKKSTPVQINQASDLLNTSKAYLDRLQNPDPAVSEAAWKEAAPRFGLSGTGKPQKQTAPGPVLSEDAADFDARTYLRTGQIPSVGMGGTAQRIQIQNRAAEIAKESGHSVDDYIEGRASLKADTSSLQNITKIRDAATGYEAGASKQLDLAVSMLPRTPEPLDSQILTRWARSGATQFGDVDVPKYQAALISGLDEYAKVITGATGAAPSSDAARALALSLVPPGATSQQVPAIVEVLKQGMQNKTAAYDEQIKDIQARLRGGEETSDAPKAPTSQRPGKFIEGKVYIDGQGNKAKYQNGQWEPVP